MHDFCSRGRRDIFRIVGAGAALLAGDAAGSSATAKGQPDFGRFFEGFRGAVLAGRRDEVAGVVAFPFTDFREGRYCEGGGTSQQGYTLETD